jgi:hypothetical protein
MNKQQTEDEISVLMMTLGAEYYLSYVSTKVLPALKNSHPTQRIIIPSPT